ncbi:MAG: nucleotidyltransferase family protein [Ignavibacteriaceae bacterium]|nr:nucleotidyltransferase family protein [Ignavibacteriaceae bacterium]
MSRSELIKILKTLNEETRQKFRGRIVGLFGSYARGDQNETSDVDLLIEKEENISIFVLGGLKVFLEEKLNKRVDIVTTSALRKEIESQIMNELIYL